MPRFVGKQSNTSAYLASLVILFVAAMVALEYAGVVDFVNGFGREKLEIRSGRDR
jgi:hypothetical protein